MESKGGKKISELTEKGSLSGNEVIPLSDGQTTYKAKASLFKGMKGDAGAQGPTGAKGADGKTRHVFFTTVRYDAVVPVFKEGDMRYAYSKQAVLFSGIADDKPLMQYLSDTYRIVQHLSFGDHHEFSRGDMNAIRKTAEEFPTSILVTTEKDSQRLLGIKDIPKTLRERTFYAPIRADFLSDDEQETFLQVLSSFLQDPSAQ